MKNDITGEKDLSVLLKTMKPTLNPGEYVFCNTINPAEIGYDNIILLFREEEGITIIIKKDVADRFKLPYSFVATWITLTVYSSLEAVGLTAAFSNVLSAAGISCNVVAALYHDHIFVDQRDAEKALEVLNSLSK